MKFNIQKEEGSIVEDEKEISYNAIKALVDKKMILEARHYEDGCDEFLLETDEALVLSGKDNILSFLTELERVIKIIYGFVKGKNNKNKSDIFISFGSGIRVTISGIRVTILTNYKPPEVWIEKWMPKSKWWKPLLRIGNVNEFIKGLKTITEVLESIRSDESEEK